MATNVRGFLRRAVNVDIMTASRPSCAGPRRQRRASTPIESRCPRVATHAYRRSRPMRTGNDDHILWARPTEAAPRPHMCRRAGAGARCRPPPTPRFAVPCRPSRRARLHGGKAPAVPCAGGRGRRPPQAGQSPGGLPHPPRGGRAVRRRHQSSVAAARRHAGSGRTGGRGSGEGGGGVAACGMDAGLPGAGGGLHDHVDGDGRAGLEIVPRDGT